MADIILIYPKTECYGTITHKDLDKYYDEPPYHLMSLSSYLKKYGFNAIITDSQDIAYIKHIIVNEKIKYVGINCVSSTLFKAVQFAKSIKSKDTNIKVILGGAHIINNEKDNDLHQLLNENIVDFLVYGDGYDSLKEILSKEDLSSINGIVYRQNENVLINPLPPSLKNIDSLPFPDYCQIDLSRYHNVRYCDKTIGIILSKGCSHRCIFCSIGKNIDNVPRLRNHKNIVSEIELLYIRYGMKHFVFYDQFLTSIQHRLDRICDALIDKSIKISWGTGSRIGDINKQKVMKMKKAGCDFIFFGIESGSQRIIEIIKKDINLKKVVGQVRLARKYGMYVSASFMIGLPHETEKDIKKSLMLMRQLPLNMVHVRITKAYKGTELWEMAKRRDGISMYGHADNSPLDTINLSPTEISNAKLLYFQRKAYIQFYFRFSFIIDSIRNLHFKNLHKEFDKAATLLKYVLI